MQVKRSNPTDTQVILTVSAGEAYLAPIKQQVLTQLRGTVKPPGFREGKAPLNLVEKHADPQQLQTEFLNAAVNNLYVSAAQQEDVRPIDQPQITVTKFVPFSELEFTATVDVLGKVTLADYKKIKVSKDSTKVTAKEIADVIENLKTRLAETKEVTRAAKKTDKAWIDFKGVNDKGEPVKGADGKDYPLLLGSNTFIPGFEDNVIGMKPKQTKEFTIAFPKDYQVKALASKKVTFTTTLTKLEEVIEPKLDAAFAAKVGPFTSIEQLKKDISKQLEQEHEKRAQQKLEADVVKAVTEKSKLNIPEVLVTDQVAQLKRELQQNLTYKGMTFKEYLEQQGQTEEEFERQMLIPDAQKRVKAGLVLAEVAEAEKLTVTPEELEIRMQILKGQYTDQAMQAELEKPEARRDIASRLLTEKTIKKLIEYCKK